MKQTIMEAGEPQAAAPQVHAPANEPRPCAVPQTHLQSATAPPMKVPDGEAIAFDHPDPAVGEVRLMAAPGTTDRDLYRGIVEQLGDAVSYGRDEQALDFMLSSSRASSRATRWRRCWPSRWPRSTWRR
jgi:hypothetical protein